MSSPDDIRSEAGILAWLLGRLAQITDLPESELDVDASFADLGVSSRDGIGLVGELQVLLDRDLPATILWEQGTVRALAGRLAESGPPAPAEGGASPGDPRTTAGESDKDRSVVNEPIAIIGLACRFPGARGPDSFWQLLAAGEDGVTARRAIPVPGIRTTGAHGFLHDVDRFDAEFFGISPVEADRMDPQQRLLLEVTWEALENAGIVPSTLRGSRTGVFVGISNVDYGRLGPGASGHPEDRYLGTGQAASLAANRISYIFDFHGPSLAVDTACSSSLVAVDQACRALRAGEASIAIAGGVNVILSDDVTAIFGEAGMMSATGRCHTFDEAADGYVRSEGCGAVVLKPLSAADRDGDHVLAVVRGSAVNQDGHSNGITAPNGRAQEDVVQRALGNATTAAADIAYVEAHGTGTPLGDPIEIRALVAALGDGRSSADHLARQVSVGSVKANIGHTEAAAGIAGLVKVVLMLQHDLIPPQPHLHTVNPLIPGAPWMRISATGRDWPRSERPRVAGVSSFGFGGTNAHVVVADPASPVRTATQDSDRSGPPSASPPQPQLLVLGARTSAALARMAGSYADYLERRPDVTVSDICRTVTASRTSFSVRAGFVASSRSQLQEQLSGLAGGADSPSVIVGKVGAHQPLTFLFSGQGTQYVRMGQELFANQPVYREALARCDELLRPQLRETLLSVLFPAPDDTRNLLDQTEYAQPALFAVEYALAQMWLSWGVRPDLVAGHSVGEYVAACVAGVISLEVGLKLVAERGRLMQDLAPGGGMLSILAGEAAVQQIIDDHPVDIAAVNGRNNTVIAGPLDSLRIIGAQLDQRGIGSRLLRVSHAFHSRLMVPARDRFAELAESITYAAPQIPLLSDLDGHVFEGTDRPDSAYWIRHLHEPVRFADVTTQLGRLGSLRQLEIGPGKALCALVRADLPATLAVPSLHPNGNDQETVLGSLARLHVEGIEVNWEEVHQGQGRIDAPGKVPTYPFEPTRHWLPAGADESDRPVDVQHGERPPGSLPEVFRSPSGPPADIAAFITEIFADSLQIRAANVDPDRSFVEIGADSFLLMNALQRIRTRFELELPISRLFEDLNTVNRLAAYVATARPALAEASRSAPDAPATRAAITSGTADGRSATPDGSGLPMTAPPTGEHTLDHLLSIHGQVMTQALNLLHTGAITTPADGRRERPASSPERPAAPAERPDPVRPAETFVAYSAAPPARSDGLDARQRAFVNDLVARHTRRTERSRAHARSERVVHADIRHVLNVPDTVRGTRYPVVVERSAGSHVWDLDGNEYIDIAMGFGVNFFGHGEPFITEAITRQLQLGMQLGPQPAQAYAMAAMISELTGAERTVFCNTGSEAVMTALRLARTATGRNRIALFAGSYHGSADTVMVRSGMALGQAVPLAPGLPAGIGDDVMILPYGEAESLRMISEHCHELAAVLVEPVQSRRPDLVPAEFLRELRQLLTAAGTPLIFDEVITGFRMHPGGVQALLGVRADITVYGKVIGGGLPIGVVAGKAAYLDGIDGGAWDFESGSDPDATRTYFSGTFCKHPLALSAGVAVLERMRQEGPGLQQRVSDRAAGLVARLNLRFEALAVPIRMVGFGSLFRFRFLNEASFWSETIEVFHLLLAEHGLFVWEGRNCFLSTAHTDEDVDAIFRAVEAAVTAMLDAGFFGGGRAGSAALGSADRTADLTYPLSEVQREIWFLDQLGSDHSRAYIEMAVVDLEGNLDLAVLQHSLRSLVDRHEILRTVVHPDGESQSPGPAGKFVVDVVDLSMFPVAERNAMRADWMAEQSNRPFSLTEGPLLRAGVLKLEAGRRYQIVLTAHHAIVDGWSFDILLRELAELYSAGVTENPPNLGPAVQYREHVKARSRRAAPGVAGREKDEAYWASRFADGLAPVQLPADRPRPARVTHRGDSLEMNLRAATGRRLRKAAARQETTPFALMLSSFLALLHRLTQEPTVVVGVPVALRDQIGGDRIVGNCTNMVPISSHLAPAASLADLAVQVRQSLIQAHDHAGFAISALAGRLAADPNATRAQLLNVLFNLDHELTPVRFAGLETSIAIPRRNYVKSDLFVDARTSGDELLVTFEYNSDLFDRSTVMGFMSMYSAVLEESIERPAQPVSTVALLDDEGWSELRRGGLGPRVDVPDTTVAAMFGQQARETPLATALVCGPERLTYADLDRRADQLAHYLIERGVRPEQRIGIQIGRTVDLVVAVLAVLKSGAAYVPLDPAMPQQRQSLIREAAGITVIISDRVTGEHPGPDGPAVVSLTADRARIEECPAGPVPVHVDPDTLCYVLYTSGSSGQPKGVAVTHRNLVNAYLGWEQAYGLRQGVRAHLQMANVGFDVFAGDLVRSLLSGGSLVLCPSETLLRPDQMFALIQEEQIDCAEFVPVIARRLVAYAQETERTLPGMKLLIVGSDVVHTDELDRLAELSGPETRVINSYGLTETTIDSTFMEHRRGTVDAETGSPIGVPFANVEVYVLDDQGQPVPVGVPGRLHIGGAGVTRGYLGRPDLTAERFIPHPWSRRSGDRLFDTGDMVRWVRHDDRIVLVYLGRQDGQLKIRGNRVETGEIESCLRRLPGIRDAVVTGEESPSDGVVLTAYLTRDSDTGEGSDDLAVRWYEGLRDALPLYMIPQRFVELPALPVSERGKVDRAALNRAGGTELVLHGRRLPPRTPLEEEMADLWTQLLGRRPESVLDEFFALGGHSLIAMQLIALIVDRWDVPFSISSFFAGPTVAATAAEVGRLRGEVTSAHAAPSPSVSERVLSPAQRRFWFVDQFWGGHPVYMISGLVHLRGRLDVRAAERSFNDLVDRHDLLRATFPVVGSKPVVRVRDRLTLDLPVIDLSSVAASDLDEELQRLAAGFAHQRIDLASGPVMQLALLRLTESTGRLLLNVHHIAADFWSIRILIDEWVQLYTARVRRQPPPALAAPGWFGQDKSADGTGAGSEVSLAYWRRQLHDLPPAATIPYDRPEPGNWSLAAGWVSLSLPPGMKQRLVQLAQHEGVSLYMVLLSALQIVLATTAGTDDVSVGAPVANRSRPEHRNAVGPFINTIVLRTSLGEDPTLRQVIERVKVTCLDAYSHADLPFDRLVDEMGIAGSGRRQPPFRVLFQYLDDAVESIETAELQIRFEELKTLFVENDLLFETWGTGDGITGLVRFRAAVYDDQTITLALRRWQAVLAEMIDDLGVRISGLRQAHPAAQLPELIPATGIQILVPEGVSGTAAPETSTVLTSNRGGSGGR